MNLKHKFSTYIRKLLVPKLIYLVLIILGTSFLAFMALRLASGSNNLSDDNAFISYFMWLKNVLLYLDLGRTIEGKSVVDRLIQPISNTLLLTSASLLISFSLSFLFGYVWSKFDKSFFAGSIFRLLNLISSIPLFIAAFIIHISIRYSLIYINEPSTTISSILIYYLTPILVLAIFDGFIYEMTNFIKLQIDNIKNEKFLIALELRGGNVNKHLIKHIMLGVLSIAYSKFIHLIGGAIVVEIIFNWEGIGLQGFKAVMMRDYSLFLGVLLFTSICAAIFYLIIYLINITVNKNYRMKILNHTPNTVEI